MSQFAKLFETKVGQLLCVLNMHGNDGPEISFIVKPAGLGLCTTTLGFTDEEGAQQCFDRLTADMGMEAIKDVLEISGGIS